MCLLTKLCYNSDTIFVLNIFKTICIYLGMMQSLHPQIWRNMGVILRTCGGINDLNIVSFIGTLCITESTTLSISPFSDGLIIPLCICLTEISIDIFGKTPFWFNYGLETLTTSLETHDGLTLGWEITNSTLSYLNIFVMVLHIEQHIISFSVKNSIWGIFALILCPLLTKLRAAPWEIIVSFIKFLIVG